MQENGPGHRDPGHKGKSILTQGQRRLLYLVLVLSAFMVANSLFLSSVRLLDLFPFTAVPSLPAFYQVMILSHIFAGWLLLLPALIFAFWHLTRVWRRHHGWAVWTGLALLACAGVLAVSGPYIQTQASSREHRGMFWCHAGAALVVVVAYATHRIVSSYRPTARTIRRGLAVIGLLLLASLAIHLGLRTPSRAGASAGAAKGGTGPAAAADRTDPFVPFTPQGDVPPERLFFPAAATTTTLGLLPARVLTNGDLPSPSVLAEDMSTLGFLSRDQVGAATCVRCHADIVEQWSRSAHRFSSFNNPFYRRTIEAMRERDGFKKSKWCSSCHDPVLMLPGDMDRAIDPASAHAQAGLTCLACHQIDRIHNVTGNGAYNIPDTEPEPYLFSESKGWVGRGLHDMIVKARPESHKTQMLKPFFRTGEYCSVCHKVSLDVPVNDYRWFRGQNEYDNWFDSGVNHAAARTFYLPPARKVCQDCHMPLEPALRGDVSAKGGMVRSHRFLAVNTALPYVRGDEETVRRTEAFLRDEKLSIDVFALRSQSVGSGEAAGRTTSSSGGERLFLALDQAGPSLVPGESAEFHVVVRNKGVGHTFPGGTNDSNEGWIDFRITDEQGRDLYRSGAVEPNGHLDPKAHKYHAIIVDADSAPVHTRIPSTFRAMVYARVIGPSTSDLARYRFQVSPDLAGRRLRVQADLKWRKFDRAYTEFVYQGKNVPDLPVTTIASSAVTLEVAGAGSEQPTSPPPSASHQPPAASSSQPPAASRQPPASPHWSRFNDYGIALLLQGDSRAAIRAFEEVARLVPEKPDGERNLARIALSEGNLQGAMEHLRNCEKVASGDPQTAFFWGEALQRSGLYDDGVRAYRRVLQYFPQDRQALFQLARTYYLAGKFPEALAEFMKVLEIDPEHREAHYHRMLCYRALGKGAEASEAEKAYLKYQIDETAQEFTRNFRLKYPEANFEAQRIHVHD